MLRVFADAGLNATRRLEDGVVELTMPIPRSAGLGETSRYLDAVAGREQQAEWPAWNRCSPRARSR